MESQRFVTKYLQHNISHYYMKYLLYVFKLLNVRCIMADWRGRGNHPQITS